MSNNVNNMIGFFFSAIHRTSKTMSKQFPQFIFTKYTYIYSVLSLRQCIRGIISYGLRLLKVRLGKIAEQAHSLLNNTSQRMICRCRNWPVAVSYSNRCDSCSHSKGASHKTTYTHGCFLISGCTTVAIGARANVAGNCRTTAATART